MAQCGLPARRAGNSDFADPHQARNKARSAAGQRPTAVTPQGRALLHRLHTRMRVRRGDTIKRRPQPTEAPARGRALPSVAVAKADWVLSETPEPQTSLAEAPDQARGASVSDKTQSALYLSPLQQPWQVAGQARRLANEGAF